MSEPVTLLMSRPAATEFEPRIRSILQGRPYRLIDLASPAEPDGTYPTNVAFITREVTGNSGKTKLSPELERFYEIIRASPRLRWLQGHAAGADRPIFREMMNRDVVVTTGSGANAGPVAQMALTGLLALARRLPQLMDAQRRKSWEPLLGARAPIDLHAQSVMVVGLGQIGSEIARLCKCLGMRVIGVRRNVAPLDHTDQVVGIEDVSAALPGVDWVVLSCPLTESTRGLLDASRLALLPQGARVINVARGEVVVEADLIAALQSGHLGGAYLDVFEAEPLSGASPLWDLPNVIITPHSAGHTAGHAAAVAEIFLDNLGRWLSGEQLRNTVG